MAASASSNSALNRVAAVGLRSRCHCAAVSASTHACSRYSSVRATTTRRRVKPSTRLRPRNRLRATGLDLAYARADFHGPRRLGIHVDFLIEAIEKLSRQCRALLCGKSQGLYEQLF
jgi:hypothetical protein